MTRSPCPNCATEMREIARHDCPACGYFSGETLSLSPAQADNYRELAHALTVCETALREIQRMAEAESGSGDPLAWVARHAKTALFKAGSYLNDADRARGQFLGQAHAPKREGKPLAPRFSPSERPAPENPA